MKIFGCHQLNHLNVIGSHKSGTTLHYSHPATMKNEVHRLMND